MLQTKACVTLQPCFQNLVLDRDLLVAIIGRMDMLVDSVMKASILLPTVNKYCGKMGIQEGATGEWYHRVPHAPSETSTPVRMGCILLGMKHTWLGHSWLCWITMPTVTGKSLQLPKENKDTTESTESNLRSGM